MIIGTCPLENFNSTNGTCSSSVVFVEQEGLLPSLSVADAFLLGSLVISCWALGFSFKFIRKFLFR